jgi:hypothetical protein
MRKIYYTLVALLLLLQLTACTGTGLPGIAISKGTPTVTATGSQAEEQQLAQRLFKQINDDAAHASMIW